VSAPFDPVTEFPRIGYLWENGDSTRPEVPALLHFNQERGLYLEVPFTSGSHEGAGRWFGRKAEGCPEQLLFQDHELDLHLFGVHVATTGRDPRYEPGLGGLRAEFAVEDRDRSDVEYAHVASVRSEINGLHEFMGWRLTEMDFSSPPDVPGPVLRVTPQTAVELGEMDGLRISLGAIHWAGPDRPNVSAVGESTVLRTDSTTPRPVEDHLRLHEALRDLLAVVCWKPFDFSGVTVQREDAPARSLGGTAMHAEWRQVHSPYLTRRDQRDPKPEVRFTDVWGPASFDAIGAGGLMTWLRRREELARFVDPLVALRFAPVITPELALMQTSIAAEALAYLRAIRSGVDENSAAHESFESRLRGLVGSQPLEIGDLAGDQQTWIVAAKDAYNGVKHANLPLPERPLPTLIALTMTGLLRSHLFLELGVDPATIGKLAENQSWWGLRSAYAQLSGWPSAPEET
jgi:hypothetical protein